MDSRARILDAVSELIFVKGNFRATSKEIAEHAGVERPLIYYYFKNVENLIKEALLKTRVDRDTKILEILNIEIDFKSKIEKLIDIHFEETSRFPFRQIFIVTNRKYLSKDSSHTPADKIIIEKLKTSLRNEIANNAFKNISEEHFIINLNALLNYPLLVKNIAPELLGLSEEKYLDLISNRKQIILDALGFN